MLQVCMNVCTQFWLVCSWLLWGLHPQKPCSSDFFSKQALCLSQSDNGSVRWSDNLLLIVVTLVLCTASRSSSLVGTLIRSVKIWQHFVVQSLAGFLGSLFHVVHPQVPPAVGLLLVILATETSQCSLLLPLWVLFLTCEDLRGTRHFDDSDSTCAFYSHSFKLVLTV